MPGSLLGWILALFSVCGKPAEPGLFEACFAGFADGLAAAVVFVVGGDIADTGVQADGVVVVPGVGEFSAQGGRVGDHQQVGELVLEVAVQRLDPGLVGGGAGPAEVLGDRAQRQELPG